MLKTITRKFRIYRHRHLKFDFIAAIVVFLVAIPLCLGIALASNAPLFSGILGGIIGGIVVGLCSGSSVSVSGPAAGMAAVVATAIVQLGGFNNFLLALFLAGCIQILIGIFRAGFISDFVPSNVVQGLLCAIGVLLIVKQLPLAFTLSKTFLELKSHLMETTESLTVQPVYNLYQHVNEGAVIISLVSFFMLVYFEKTKHHALKKIPAPILVVFAGILLNELFIFLGSDLTQSSPQLVHIPKHENWLGFFKQVQFPNFDAWTQPAIYMNAIVIAIVASLESLLNIRAAEKLDVKKRVTSKSRELVAQGMGNMLAGLFGAIPITSVIVRSSVNIQAGARTKFAGVLHGIFLCVAVMLIPRWLNKIPLSSLAAILIYTGYKLTKPSIYKTMYEQGADRFIPFIATVVSIVAFNLLEGVLIGLAISFFYILKSNSQARLDIIQEIKPRGMANRLVLPQQISFLNKASLVAELNAIPKNSKLTIDARYTNYIDQDIIEFLHEFRAGEAKYKNITLNLIGFQEKYALHKFIDFINVTAYDPQSNLTPRAVLKILKEGNHRFLNDQRIHRSAKLDIQQTARVQRPIAVVLGCIDSRVPVETVFDMSFGDLFCIRIAGNIVNQDILASMEYACHIIGAKLIVILGHTHCGAILSACDGVEEGHITHLLAKIKPAIEAETETHHEHRCSKNPVFVEHVTQYNIANTLSKVYDDSPILKQMIQEGTVGMVGAVYDVQSGQVSFDDYSTVLDRIYPDTPQPLRQKIHELFVEESEVVN